MEIQEEQRTRDRRGREGEGGGEMEEPGNDHCTSPNMFVPNSDQQNGLTQEDTATNPASHGNRARNQKSQPGAIPGILSKYTQALSQFTDQQLNQEQWSSFERMVDKLTINLCSQLDSRTALVCPKS